jgi:aspartyl-tRNA(Asn)/glutamyl-tRNA(Gln) amidotransferase subunit B
MGDRIAQVRSILEAHQAIAANPTQVEQFRAGNPKVLQFMVGQVMKLSRGKANPKLVSEILMEKLK